MFYSTKALCEQSHGQFFMLPFLRHCYLCLAHTHTHYALENLAQAHTCTDAEQQNPRIIRPKTGDFLDEVYYLSILIVYNG